LKDTARFLDDLLNQFTFVDRQREWLFAVDVFARVHCFDGNLCVPMIRRSDHDRVDVFSVENLSIVIVGIRFLALALLNLGHVFAQHIRVDVSQRGKVSELERLAGDRPALISKSNRGEDRSVIWRLVAKGSVGRRQQNASNSRCSDALKKLTTR